MAGQSLIRILTPLLVGLLLAATAAPGASEMVGDLNVPRSGHTLTRLDDGRVLVAGGTTDGFLVADTAEIYDPAAGTFRLLPSRMSAGRSGHGLVRLGDGTYLVTGGYGDLGVPATRAADIFDPRDETFRPVGPMILGRAGHATTLLEDGQVLVTGGAYAGGIGKATGLAEIYDPASESFLPAAPMLHARHHHFAARLEAGRVLIAGGRPDGSSTADTAEIYDPATGAFQVLGEAPRPCYAENPSGGLYRLASGRLFMICHNAEPPALPPGALVFDPSSRSFAVMEIPARSTFMAQLPDGRILIPHPEDPGRVSAYLLDPLSGSALRAGSPRIWRGTGARSVTLLDGGVLLTGGPALGREDEMFPTERRVEIFRLLPAGE